MVEGKHLNLGVSRHKAIHVVIDLLEYEASVHESEAALSEKGNERLEIRISLGFSLHKL